QELLTRSRARSVRASDAQRAKLILLLAEQMPFRAIQDRLDCSQMFINRWKQRFVQERLDGLYGRHRGSEPGTDAARLEAKILNAVRKAQPDGSTHWTTRKMATHLGVSHMRVARVWARAGIKPHRLDRYMASTDPDFETKAVDILGLYVNPPQHAAVFSLDEKTAIQALDRRDPVLPLSPGRAERHGFEYIRNGTLSLYAALNTKTGTVLGKTAARHASEEFVAFLGSLVAMQPATQEIHIILDNLSTHKTRRVQDFLAEHGNVHLHFTPTYSSWLNQVELWFGKIQRDVITRGVFTSATDLNRKLMRYIREHNKTAKPIKWKYSDPTRRIRANHSAVTVH
ncbi:MAG: IS630 family transposase, partial [Actinobacteria bacterium]|nr:IS630 family transposase [Actinomycetota bacterium]